MFDGWDPIAGTRLFYGSGVTQTASIEPRTPEGEIYTTQPFAALAILSGDRSFDTQYVGTLPTAKDYGDFELEFEVKLDTELNSGCQIRSNSTPEYKNGRVHGYQVEISTNGHAGFIYDEARRGWLSTDVDNPEKQAEFKDGEWNKYRIVCRGDSIRTWINGRAVADLTD
ncbi:MAG: DUF1080 domain-containing protein, partial [Acidobacteria bacterium]|nr:DUF1080 domain-containing protein [Acidobacteriota bacterium]